MSDQVDVLVVSLGTTRGLRLADAQLVDMLREAGASVAAVSTRIGVTNALRRAYPVNDAVEAIAARRAFIAASRRYRPRAVVFSTTTAALFVGDPGVPFAVWLDSPARLNRPGVASTPLHALERRQLARARVLMPHSPGAVEALPVGSAPTVLVPPPIPAAPPAADTREPFAIGYTPDPKAKGLALLCAAWEEAELPRARLVIAGIEAERARAFLERRGLRLPAGAELAGMLPQPSFRDLLSRARVFVSAAEWEDFGIAPLEALDRGAVLVGARGGGPFPGLGIARALAPSFVADDRDAGSLARALEAAFAAPDDQLAAYRVAARQTLAPYRPEASIRRLREEVLPALLGAPRR
ncbi:MAG TPA: glycosyltransferase [Solirubrobacteraceae bacterium]|nr:glycosyltransferase [Solirubrobacteraceae bacterium]